MGPKLQVEMQGWQEKTSNPGRAWGATGGCGWVQLSVLLSHLCSQISGNPLTSSKNAVQRVGVMSMSV